jgi:hypothetical protein
MVEAQRYTEVTVILDDGVNITKQTFHKTEHVQVKGTYYDPDRVEKGIEFEISFGALFDSSTESVYTEQKLARKSAEANPMGLYDVGVPYPAAPAESGRHATDGGSE